MKKKTLILIIWYFAFGPELYTFETKAQCDKSQTYMNGRGAMVSDCDEVKWIPNAKVNQSTSGANSPAIVGGKGDVIIDGKKR